MVLYLLTLIITGVFTQYATELHSISSCLSNCLQCQHNDLDACNSSDGSHCISNYHIDENDQQCIINQIYQEQIVLINKNGEFNRLQKWETVQSTDCSYNKPDGSVEHVRVMGLFLASASNTVKFFVQPYYQSLLISFNLVRNSWIPYMDFLEIKVYDQSNKFMGRYIIEYLQREEIIDDQYHHTIQCNQQRLIVEKFQFAVDFRHKNITKISVVFNGLMHGGQLWGFTNFKVAFGCQNNLFYDGQSCFGCQPGFYLDEQMIINGAPTCHQCLPNCLSCSKTTCFTCASGMKAVDNHCEADEGFKILDKMYHPNYTICNISMLHSSESKSVHKQMIDPIPIPIKDKHINARLIFDLYLTDTQWNNESALIIEVDGRQIKKIQQNVIHNKLRQKCTEFALGYFSRIKIVTPYFDHRGSQMIFRIYSVDEVLTDFGIADINVEIQLDLSPDPQPVPIPKQQVTPSPVPVPVLPTPAPAPAPAPTPAPLPIIPKPTPIVEINEKEKMKREILKIKQKMSEIRISHNTILNSSRNNGELILNINYPLQVGVYPYIYCRFEKLGRVIPGKTTGSTNHMQFISVQITQSLVNETVVITMSPERKGVISRLLGQINSDDEVELARILIRRFDVLDINEISSILSLRVLFITITMILLILTIILLLIGKGSIILELSLLIQLLFLHIYIHGQFLPYTFKISISGFQNMENLNYLSPSAQSTIESWLLGNVVQESPIRFTEFNTDINFSRAIYPIIILNIIFVIWFLLLKLLNRVLKNKLKQMEDAKTAQSPSNAANLNVEGFSKLQRFSLWVAAIVDRPVNYCYFMLKWEFLTVIWLCFLQFFGFAYPKGADRNQTINGIFCIVSFICSVCWPVGMYLFLKHKYFTMQYEEYLHEYENIFYFQLHTQSLPSNHHRYHILLEYLRYFIYALCCSVLGNSPIESLVTLIILHIFSILYLKIARPILSHGYVRFFYVQYVLLTLLQIMMLIAYGTCQFMNKKEYLILGYFMVVVCLLLVLNAICRTIYMIYKMKTEDATDKSSFQAEYAAERIV